MPNYDFRILIIDDNPSIHKDFIKILTTQPSSSSDEFKELGKKLFNTSEDESKEILLPQFKIDSASQGQEGVKKISEAISQGNPYSLAFVDIRMPPGWDGIETIKHIWEIDNDMQIVICTAYSDYSWKETVAALGQRDNLLILKKPFDQIAVRQLACALTRKWKLAQEARSHTQFLEKSIQERTKELQHQATHDSLTGLPNRVLLQDRLDQAIHASKRNKDSFAVLFFDLDRFKLINDSLSHNAGDELLRTLAKRLQGCIRGSDTLTRLGGDEFVMIVTNLKEPMQINTVAENLLNEINKPFSITNHNIIITSSMGISIYPKDGEDKETLMSNADVAMYVAKGNGGNQFKFYSEKMNEESLKRLELQTELRGAIKNNEFFLCYQPELDLKENKLVAVEALLRWNHPTKGMILPFVFIPIAEETGLIVELGAWVLREACRQNKAWQDAGYSPIRVAVNITTPQLRQNNFVQMLENILRDTGLKPQYLELELSENSIINNVEAINTLNELKELGIYFAVDDFGTGYSSLNYLRKIPLDRLKIDRSFVQNIQINHGDEILIQAIIAMAKGLNLEILAEGVETQNQLSFLKSQECLEIQGYYFSHPLSANELGDLLKDKSKIENLLVNKKAEKV